MNNYRLLLLLLLLFITIIIIIWDHNIKLRVKSLIHHNVMLQ